MITNSNPSPTYNQCAAERNPNRLHSKAHQPINRFCVHCGAKRGGPVCKDCTRQSVAHPDFHPETGYFITADGDEIGLLPDPYLLCMQ